MLKKLYIHNFKSFWHSEFEFGKLNCLIAPNNTGKSNLIEALELVDNLLFGTDERTNFHDSELRNFKYKENNIQIDLEFEVKHSVLIYYDLIDYKSIVKFSIQLGDTSNIDMHMDGYIKSVQIEAQDHNDVAVKTFGFNNFGSVENQIKNYDTYEQKLSSQRYTGFKFSYNQNSLRYTVDTTKKGFDALKALLSLTLNGNNELSRPIDYRNIFRKRAILNSYYFLPFLMKEKQIATVKAKLNKYGTNLVEFISGQLDNTIDEISTAMIGEVEQINSIEIKEEAFKALYFMENDKYPVPLRKVSDGTLHYLAIVTALMSSDNLCEAMMFEEPERHLHLRVLSTIIEMMRDSDAQIFFTTQSMEMVQELKLDEIIFMYRDYDGNTHAKRAKDIQNIKKLMKIYKNDLVEMIKIGLLDDMNLEENS